MFQFLSNGGIDPKRPATTEDGIILKAIGVTNVGGVAYEGAPTSQNSIRALKESVQALGLKMGYQNLAFPIGGSDVGPVILAMKQVGVNGIVCGCTESTQVALLVGAKQAGLNAKMLVLSGPSPDIVQNPGTRAAAQGAYFKSLTLPLTGPNVSAGAKLLAARLKAVYPAYIGGYPQYGMLVSYISADLMVTGLKLAQSNLTPATVISRLQNVTDYNAGGLLATTISFNHFGRIVGNTCGVILQLQGSNFVSLNGGKAYCGTVIPNSDVVP
jgi:branched-chain amino acid transport system substrate-binding protein